MSDKNIFIIEKDYILSSCLQKILKDADFNVVGVSKNISEAMDKLHQTAVDMLLVDINARHHLHSDMQILIQFKKENPSIQILFLSSATDEKTVSFALKCKSSAFLIKPYRGIEIVLTMRMILSPSQERCVGTTSLIVFQKIYIYDTTKQILWKKDQQILLTPTKVRLIEILATNLNTTVSNHQICNFVWGEHRANSTLRTLVYRTKQSIEDSIINNINGVGYSINAQ